MSKYRNHGMVDRDHIDFWGINMRLQPLQAIVADLGLNKLKKTIELRNKNAKILDEGLKSLKKFVSTPKRIFNNVETFSLYMATFTNRNQLKQYLIENKIEVKIHYPIPLHLQKASSQNCIFDPKKLKNIEYQANTLLTIPTHQFLKKSQMDYIVSKICDFYKNY